MRLELFADPRIFIVRNQLRRQERGDSGSLRYRWVVGKPMRDEWVWPWGDSPADWDRHSNATI